MEAKFLHALKGKCVKLTLKNSSCVGFVQRINPNKTMLLEGVVEGGCKIPGSKLFFGREILNVEIVQKPDTGNGKAHDTFDDQVAQKEYMDKILFEDEENKEDCIHFIVVDDFQRNFFPALAHIERQQTIGVGADGIELFRTGRLCWLQIATKHKIYLFDILLLGARAFKNGLSQILGNKSILKVIHNCRVISSGLNSLFGVKLSNVFDTQVADVMYFYSETGGFLPDRVSTLEEVASLHLEIPPSQCSALEMKTKLGQELIHLFQKRPCPIPLLRVMALSVYHLMALRHALIKTFMLDYMILVDSYLESSYFKPDELQHLNMESALELPAELRQLERIHLERQQWACEHYSVTERGLLERFRPRGDREAEQSWQNAKTPAIKAAKSPLERPGKGSLFGQQQSPKPAQSAGRGFLLQMSHAQVSHH